MKTGTGIVPRTGRAGRDGVYGFAFLRSMLVIICIPLSRDRSSFKDNK